MCKCNLNIILGSFFLTEKKMRSVDSSGTICNTWNYETQTQYEYLFHKHLLEYKICGLSKFNLKNSSIKTKSI